MSVRERRRIADNHVFNIKIGPNAEVACQEPSASTSRTLRSLRSSNRSTRLATWKI